MSNLEKPVTDIYAFRELREKGFTCGDQTGIILSRGHDGRDTEVL